MAKIKFADRLDQFLDRTKNKDPNFWRYCFFCEVDWVINKKTETIKCGTFGCRSLAYAQNQGLLAQVYSVIFAAYDDLELYN